MWFGFPTGAPHRAARRRVAFGNLRVVSCRVVPFRIPRAPRTCRVHYRDRARVVKQIAIYSERRRYFVIFVI